jgi:hypothetical protein
MERPNCEGSLPTGHDLVSLGVWLFIRAGSHLVFIYCSQREREREAHIFKNLRERERFGSVFYIIHKKYIF